MCNDGMFWCAFEIVAGLGLGVLFVLFCAAMLGFHFGKDQ
jgi:hypothetical protein